MRVWVMRGALIGAVLVAAPATARATAFFDSLRRVNTVARLPQAPYMILRPAAPRSAPSGAARLPPAASAFVPLGHADIGPDGISCVPFARAESGINLKGNAANWWDSAAGVYSRGNRPERGSVLAFPATARMPLGHVAVVTKINGPRLVTIDHANWGDDHGAPARAVPVMDVSPANDWTEVRVGLGHDGAFGSPYATSGFIYNRPDRGQMSADARR